MHTVGVCALLVCAYYWWVHSDGVCVLLVCAYYWRVHTIGECKLLVGVRVLLVSANC